VAFRILVVDDDHEIVRLLRAYLEKDGYRVLVAYDGAGALHLVRSERPDLLLLDLMLPDRDGWEVTRIVRGDPILAQTPVIMLTARVEDQDKIVGLEIGADDYVVKPFNPREVLARVRAVLRRSRGEPVTAKIIEVGCVRVDVDGHEAYVSGQPLRLTPTEFNLLEALAEQPGRALTRMEMIERGLGYGYEGLDRTMDSHIKNLRHKLDAIAGAGYGAQLIETVFGVGYRMRPDLDEAKG
jgi:two-component system alkaline phosphatase synthesis response regulator PhoP